MASVYLHTMTEDTQTGSNYREKASLALLGRQSWKFAKFTLHNDVPKGISYKEVFGVFFPEGPEEAAWSAVIEFITEPGDGVAYGLIRFIVDEAHEKYGVAGQKGDLFHGPMNLMAFEVGSLDGKDLRRLHQAEHYCFDNPKSTGITFHPHNQKDTLQLLGLWGDKNPVPGEGDVHTGHCCIAHGCKYEDETCPVEAGAKLQSYLCETCGLENSGYYDKP